MARDRDTAINSYITDMISLEDHIANALKGQISDLNDYPDLGAEIRQVHHLVEHHISDLRALAERRKAGGITEAKLASVLGTVSSDAGPPTPPSLGRSRPAHLPNVAQLPAVG